MRKRARMGSFSLGGRWTCWLIATVLSLECAKTCSAAVCQENVWAANAVKRCQLPKTKPACTSQQKVDTFFIFYTLKTEHSTPYIVLVSNSLMSMQVFLH